MKSAWFAIAGATLLSLTALQLLATEPEWSASRVKDCDRECLIGFMDGYMSAISKDDPKAAPPLAIDVRVHDGPAEELLPMQLPEC